MGNKFSYLLKSFKGSNKIKDVNFISGKLGSDQSSSNFKQYFNLYSDLVDLKYYNDYHEHKKYKTFQAINSIFLISLLLYLYNYKLNQLANDVSNRLAKPERKLTLTISPGDFYSYLANYLETVDINQLNLILVDKIIFLSLVNSYADPEYFVYSLRIIQSSLKMLFKRNPKEYAKLKESNSLIVLNLNKDFLSEILKSIESQVPLVTKLKNDHMQEYITFLLIRYLISRDEEQYKSDLEQYLNSINSFYKSNSFH